MDSSGDLWAITSYFNPARYRRRLANYHHFRQQLPIPLITVELSFGPAFELNKGDAEILLQLRGGDVMWQKERLLNVALRALPDQCRKVVWMDCDTIVGPQDWPQRVSDALTDYPVVQPYGQVHHLEPDAPAGGPHIAANIAFSHFSLAWAIGKGCQVSDCLEGTLETIWGGFMWAERRELLDQHGLFDAGILGGGDYAFASAAFGCFDIVMRNEAMNERQRQSYLAWAKPFFQAVRGAVTCVDCPIYHLWHGAMSDRRYEERQRGLQPFHFDPSRDIAMADSGAWRWASDKPLLHQYVKDYFAARKEDG